jgi:hypothetical protein
MRTLRTTRLLTALAAASLMAGCLSTGVRDRNRDSDREEDDARPREVQGIVERIDPVNHRIDIASDERIDRGDLGRRGERRGYLSIYYDAGTLLEPEAGHFRPQDLRRGDSIRAAVQSTAAGLIVQRIEVLSEERGGPAPPAPDVAETPEVPAAPEPREAPEYPDDSRRDRLRGTVRYVDTGARTVEIETPPSDDRRSGLVRVQYDEETAVEFQGKRYSPENLQLGDRVEIALRGHGGQALARQIVILSGEPAEGH